MLTGAGKQWVRRDSDTASSAELGMDGNLNLTYDTLFPELLLGCASA
jgi:hypothetical protein